MQQKKNKEKYNPPKLDEEEQRSEEEEEEDEEEIQQKKKKQKKKQGKKKKEEKKEDEEEEEEYHNPDDTYNMKKALHPTAVLFTFIFKAGAAVVYLFGSTILADKLIFISVVLLMSFDFWTVKNITGRLLVGLRWWSDYDEEGNEVWRFESPDEHKSFFWTSQMAITIFWLVFLALNVISFGIYWVILLSSIHLKGILDFIGLSLSGVNLYGFYKCSGEHQDKVKNMRNKLLTKGVVSMIS